MNSLPLRTLSRAAFGSCLIAFMAQCNTLSKDKLEFKSQLLGMQIQGLLVAGPNSFSQWAGPITPWAV